MKPGSTHTPFRSEISIFACHVFVRIIDVSLKFKNFTFYSLKTKYIEIILENKLLFFYPNKLLSIFKGIFVI